MKKTPSTLISTSPSETLPPPRLIYLLNSAQRRLQQWIGLQQTQQAIAQRLDAPTAAQSGVLFVLAKSDGTTMGDLAKALDLAPSAVSGLIQRMEAVGWVQRHACAEDARTQRVWLQPAGLAQLPMVRAAMKRINRQLTSGFTADELHTVGRWLAHVQNLHFDEAFKDSHD